MLQRLKRVQHGAALVFILAACSPSSPAPEATASAPDAEPTIQILAAQAQLVSSEVGPEAGPEQLAQEQPVQAQTAPAADEADAACPSRPLDDTITRMVGGKPTTIAHWPGFTAIGAVSPNGAETTWFCGGVLIEPSTVLTAAHCLNDARRKADGSWHVKIEGVDWQLAVLPNQDEIAADGPQVRAKVISGQTYREGERRWDRVTVTNDIAVLKLDRPLTGQKLARLSGAGASDPGLDGHFLFAAGFGQLDATGSWRSVPTRAGGKATAQSPVLQDAVLPLITERLCNTAYQQIDGRQICAGWSRGKRDTCYGDSGGPLVALDTKGCPYVVGLTSFGSTRGCGAENAYGVYTRVSSFRSWITSQAPDAEFTQSPPPSLGPQATSDLLQILIEKFAVESRHVTVAMIDRETGEAFPLGADGRAIVPAGKLVSYSVTTSDGVSGQVLLIDRQQARQAADGQLRREYVMLFPNAFLFGDRTALASPGTPVTLGTGNDYRLRAGIEDDDAAFERGEVIALILPPTIKLSDMIAPPNATRAFRVEAGDDIPRAVTAMEATAALLADQSVDSAAFGSAVLPYEIRR